MTGLILNALLICVACLVIVFSPSSLAKLSTLECDTYNSATQSFSKELMGNRIAGSKPQEVRVAAVFGEDNRFDAPKNVYPYSAIGFLYSSCTAFRVSACHIMTAAHCVYDSKGTLVPGSDTFLNSSVEPSVSSGAVRSKKEEGILWMPFQGPWQDDRSKDWAIGKLREGFGTQTGFFGLTMNAFDAEASEVYTEKGELGPSPSACAATSGQQDSKVNVTGFSGDRSGLSNDPQAVVVRQTKQTLEARADQYIGASGGPYWTCVNGVAYVHGITSSAPVKEQIFTGKPKQVQLAEDETRSGRLSIAAATGSFFDEARIFMMENPCTQ